MRCPFVLGRCQIAKAMEQGVTIKIVFVPTNTFKCHSTIAYLNIGQENSFIVGSLYVPVVIIG